VHFRVWRIDRRSILTLLLLPVAVVAFLLAKSVPSAADTWDDAVAAHLAGDDETALRLALELARKGDVKAQSLAGFLYMFGNGVPQDRHQAVYWDHLAAERGDSGAQANLCSALAKGDPAEFDPEKAAYWCRISAAHGSDIGLLHLGLLYHLGRGVQQDSLEAYVWLSLAELNTNHPHLRRAASDLKAQAVKGLSAAEITEAGRRISAWKSDQP
jgi:TPR repeat protein